MIFIFKYVNNISKAAHMCACYVYHRVSAESSKDCFRSRCKNLFTKM